VDGEEGSEGAEAEACGDDDLGEGISAPGRIGDVGIPREDG